MNRKENRENIVEYIFLSFTNETRPNLTIKRNDCSEKLNTKTDIASHNKEKHYKTSLCPF